MTHKIKKISIAMCCLGLLLTPALSFVAPTPVFSASLKSKILKQQNALAGNEGAGLGQAKDPRIIVANIIRVLLGLVGTLIVIYFVYGGFLWMTASGNDEQVTKAKGVIKNTVIGLVIVLTAYSVTQFVSNSLLSATTGGGPGGQNNQGGQGFYGN